MLVAMSKRAAKERIKDARQELYREHILDAAEKIFAEAGYEDAKVGAMATAAGVSLTTLYRSFETKLDVYRGIHARRTTALREHLARRTPVQAGPLERLLAGIAAYVEFHMENPDYLRMHLRAGYAWSSVASVLQSPEQFDTWTEGLAMATRAFQAAIQAGMVVDDGRPDLMARTMIAMHQVRLADWVDRGMKDSPDELTQAVHREFIRTFCTPRGAASQAKASKPRGA